MNLGQTLTFGQTVWALSPELVLLVTAILVLILDVVRPHQEGKRWPPYVTLAGLAVAGAAVVSLWLAGCNTRVLAVVSCDPFSLAVKFIALLAMAIVVLSSDVFIRTRKLSQGVFYALLLFSTLAICLLGASVDLIMIFLAFDFLSIVSYVLTGYLRGSRRSAEAAIKYMLYGAGLSAMMLYAMSWLYGLTGQTNLEGIASTLAMGEQMLRPMLFPILIMLLAGFAFKIGAVPFHQWAPDAYEGAPTPVTAFLSVGPKIAGFALLVRITVIAFPSTLNFVHLDWRTLLMAITAVTMTLGNLVALWQRNIKRMLAYSSIAQAGYILIGVVAASPLGTAGVLIYLLAYAVTNLGAFAAIIAFSNQVGSDYISDYAGLSKRAPGLAALLLISLLSLGGIPPTAGFFGKVYLFSAALQSGLIWLAVVGVINSVISLGYYWKVIREMYMVEPKSEDVIVTPRSLGVALGVTMTGVLLVGIFSNPLLHLLEPVVRVLFLRS
ncbi:MAG: NADH-quinone oxidoreductase subunit N [Anaerolineae bacterium]|nr:NADH-quinone oxidoreductase subunit N [Anaerolineae bacterium]